ncbi:ParB/RepB/Spo0J family partition protein [Pararhizobium sp. BT-229]|uniref:ParB/RepB/Spo0J family partition protein n=1 Tax=Pararhizobium sp. BT-229 TaxID=2986923 RepID=UPI0021F740C6|nr:ParB/RepB/Spo0J family partition protein [Pararhizobium sp. BT-229]MCV9960767.1 ParB/RepB/Spo0J family partition protein [Pararhizobium sp. BT-229]
MLTTDRLVLDTNNARKMRDKDSLASLKASILAHGIIQPITIRPPAAADRDLEGDRYRVFAGGRRLSAVSELIFEGKLPADYAMPALIKDVDDNGADEMSLAENILRRSMRPVDEFKAFSRLADEGATADDIALRFGQSLRFVQGRMALGRLHPVLLEMLDLDEIRLEVAMAYTLESDPERQLEIYNNLQGYQKTSSVYIKEAIAGTGTKSNGGVAKFIGETRYILAGGKVTHDLFEDHSFWVSADIIEKLKAERIAEIRDELLGAGWSFAKTTDELDCNYWEMKRLTPEETGLPPEQQARLDEVQAQLEEFDEVDIEELPEEEQERFHALDTEYDELSKAAKGVHSAEQRAASGVIIRTDRSYELDYGMVPPGAKMSSSSSDKPERDPLTISAPVLSDLGKAATVALAEAVEAQPDKALALLAALLELGPTSPWQHHRPGRLKIVAPGDTSGTGYAGMTAKRSFSEAFEAYAAMSPDDLKSALAQLVSGTVDVSQEWLSSNADMRKATLETFGVDPTPHFDVDGFFTAARKPIISAAYKEITGQDLKDGKKGDMVAITVEVAKKIGWLPEYLRTSAYKFGQPDAPAAVEKKSRAKKK